MATHEIPREKWGQFFQEFSARHKNTKVEIERVSPTDGIKVEAKWLPFAGIRFDEGASTIVVRTGEQTGNGDDHPVSNPRLVYHKSATGVMSAEETHDEIVEITTTGDPPVTYLRFRPNTPEIPLHTSSLES